MYQSFPVGTWSWHDKPLVGGTQVYSYKKPIFVNKITTAVAISVYIKYISGFKIIGQYLLEKYDEENILLLII